MGGLVPRLNCPDEARRSNPHRRPPCVIRFPSRGSCELPLPEGLVGFAKRLLLRDANVFEEVMTDDDPTPTFLFCTQHLDGPDPRA